jgi:hypothetical protein
VDVSGEIANEKTGRGLQAWVAVWAQLFIENFKHPQNQGVVEGRLFVINRNGPTEGKKRGERASQVVNPKILWAKIG